MRNIFIVSLYTDVLVRDLLCQWMDNEGHYAPSNRETVVLVTVHVAGG